MAVGFPTKANWAAGDVLTASAMDDLAGTVNLTQYMKPWNQVLNSNFSVWQRGTSIACAVNANTYTADRWILSNNANQAATVARYATSDTTNLPNIQYCARYQRNSGQTGTGTMNFAQSFETINSVPFAGKPVVLSFYARAGANYSAASNALVANIFSGTGTDQNIVVTGYTGQATVATATATLTTTWQRFSLTGTVSASATELSARFDFVPTGTAGTNDYYEITGVQMELGSVANIYQPNQATYEAELAACQRYLPAMTTNGANGQNIMGYSYATNSGIYSVGFNVTARVAPTGITQPGVGNFICFNSTNGNASMTNLIFDSAGLNGASVASTATLTAGQPSRILIGATGYILFTGCEL